MMNIISAMAKNDWLLVVAIISAVLAAIAAIFLVMEIVKMKKVKKAKDNGVTEVDGVRYTSDKAMVDGFKDDVNYIEKDIILEIGKTYTVGKDELIIPGKYTIRSAVEGTEKFNARIGTFVREYSHMSDIVVSEGESITAVSHCIILR